MPEAAMDAQQDSKKAEKERRKAETPGAGRKEGRKAEGYSDGKYGQSSDGLLQ